MHAGDNEVLFGHGPLELVHSLLGVAVDDGLLDIQVGVQVEQDVHLPLVLLDGDVVLVDTLKGQVLFLHEDLRRRPHEVLGEAKNIGRQSRREQANLNVGGQELEDLLDLRLEAAGEHLVSLVQDEELEVVRLQEASPHHVMDTSWCAHDNVLALLKDTDVLTHDCATNTRVHLGLQVLTDGVDHEGDLHGEFTRW